MSKKSSKQQYDEWNKDPENWIRGIFYYNKKDKRIFPPKRNKILGWTINFANPKSLFALIILLVVIYFLVHLYTQTWQ